jgi:hypothetical protein
MAAAFTTPAAVANAAIQLIGGFNNQGPLTGTPPLFDNTTLGIAAGAVYQEVFYAVGREFGFDFSLNLMSLTPSGGSAPYPFTREYLYPPMGIEVRDLYPPSGGDPHNPLPTNFNVGNRTISGIPTKVIWTFLADAMASISNAPPEALWDALFQEAVIQGIAAKLAMAGVGKPDLLREYGDQGARTTQAAIMRDG